MTVTPNMDAVDVPLLVMASANTIVIAEPDVERKSRRVAAVPVTGAPIRTKPRRWKVRSRKKT
jgi:hypothetical protein